MTFIPVSSGAPEDSWVLVPFSQCGANRGTVCVLDARSVLYVALGAPQVCVCAFVRGVGGAPGRGASGGNASAGGTRVMSAWDGHVPFASLEAERGRGVLSRPSRQT